MNIDSKRYNIRASGLGQIEIRDKSTGLSKWVAASDVPSHHRLAAMTEAEFDRVCSELGEG